MKALQFDIHLLIFVIAGGHRSSDRLHRRDADGGAEADDVGHLGAGLQGHRPGDPRGQSLLGGGEGTNHTRCPLSEQTLLSN